MKDTDFEQDSRAHSFWQEWQGAADRAGEGDTYSEVLDIAFTDSDMFKDNEPRSGNLSVRGSIPFDPFSKSVADSSPDWDFVVNGEAENDLVINLT